MNDLKINDRQKSLVDYYLPSVSKLEKLAAIYQVFSDKTRLRILFALCICPMCVNDIAKTTGINRSTVSHQLAAIKVHGFVKGRSEGKNVIYFISDARVKGLLSAGTKAY
ncbi:MAG: winged helix-turn-helix transcriptional regulator [Clostridia bacterium]|nr:winged helix-turn-helix transcriptional regulator [Clostridia bacterium]